MPGCGNKELNLTQLSGGFFAQALAYVAAISTATGPRGMSFGSAVVIPRNHHEVRTTGFVLRNAVLPSSSTPFSRSTSGSGGASRACDGGQAIELLLQGRDLLKELSEGFLILQLYPRVQLGFTALSAESAQAPRRRLPTTMSASPHLHSS